VIAALAVAVSQQWVKPKSGQLAIPPDGGFQVDGWSGALRTVPVDFWPAPLGSILRTGGVQADYVFGSPGLKMANEDLLR
jgi:hypothetical protein